jgi:hypothetical protein
MTVARHRLAWVAWSLLLLATAQAERRHDPLNPLEIDQLRDTATAPDDRLKLYVKFARARLELLDQARSDPKVTSRGQAIHDRLQDFLDVYDELNDNIDTYMGRKADVRKSLKAIIEADTEFQAKLRALRDSAEIVRSEAKQYEFLLGNTLDTLDSSVEDHRQSLAQQEEDAKHKKLVKPQ